MNSSAPRSYHNGVVRRRRNNGCRITRQLVAVHDAERRGVDGGDLPPKMGDIDPAAVGIGCHFGRHAAPGRGWARERSWWDMEALDCAVLPLADPANTIRGRHRTVRTASKRILGEDKLRSFV